MPASVLTVHRLTPTEIQVTGPEALCEWREACRLPVPGHEYTPAYKKRQWDGTWAPGRWCRQRGVDVYDLRCSRGLLERINAALCPDAVLVPPDPAHLHAARQYAEAHPRWTELRDYQQAAFFHAVTAEWGRLALATNAGKGAVIALLAAWAVQQQGVPVLICCDEVAVYDALAGELAAWTNIAPACVRAGITDPPALGPRVTLAMVPTLTRRLGPESREDRTAEHDAWRAWLAGQQMLLLDEADKATAPSWRNLLRLAKATRWRLGFSGTFPEALSYADWLLEEGMGPVLLEKKNRELVARGISATPRVTLVPYDVTAAVHQLPPFEEWRGMRGAARRQWTYEQAIVYNPERHAHVAAQIRPGAPTAVIVNRVEHGEQLKAVIPGSVFLDGTDSELGRITALEAFRKGKFHVLIVTKILDRGTNRLGFAADVIFASAEGSTRQTLQRIGRGLRRADGKAFLRLVDVMDRVVPGSNKRLQRVAEYLHRAARDRVALYTNEGFEVEVQS